MKIKVLLIVLGILALFASFVAWYFLRPSNDQVIINQGRELYTVGLGVDAVKPKDATEKLLNSKVIDNNKVTLVEIIFTKQKDLNAAYLREDIPGKPLISSGYTRADKKVTVTLFVSEELTSMTPNKQTILLNDYFWKVADLIAMSNSGTNQATGNHEPIFIQK